MEKKGEGEERARGGGGAAWGEKGRDERPGKEEPEARDGHSKGKPILAQAKASINQATRIVLRSSNGGRSDGGRRMDKCVILQITEEEGKGSLLKRSNLKEERQPSGNGPTVRKNVSRRPYSFQSEDAK